MVSDRVKVHLGLAAALIVLIGCVALLIAGTMQRVDARAVVPGSVAPDFALRDADDHPVQLSELRGNVVIVYFHGRGTRDASICPTSNPASSMQIDSVAVKSPAESPAKDQSVAAIGNKMPQYSLASASTADLLQLSEMCRKLHSPRVKVLDLESPLTLANPGSLALAQEDATNPVKTLLDPAGDVAREYKIDGADSKPTFFVIDPSGVIRFRGNSLDAGGNSTTDQLLSPATQPSSCPQVVQTLLSSEAMNVALPPSARP